MNIMHKNIRNELKKKKSIDIPSNPKKYEKFKNFEKYS